MKGCSEHPAEAAFAPHHPKNSSQGAPGFIATRLRRVPGPLTAAPSHRGCGCNPRPSGAGRGRCSAASSALAQPDRRRRSRCRSRPQVTAAPPRDPSPAATVGSARPPAAPLAAVSRAVTALSQHPPSAHCHSPLPCRSPPPGLGAVGQPRGRATPAAGCPGLRCPPRRPAAGTGPAGHRRCYSARVELKSRCWPSRSWVIDGRLTQGR